MHCRRFLRLGRRVARRKRIRERLIDIGQGRVVERSSLDCDLGLGRFGARFVRAVFVFGNQARPIPGFTGRKQRGRPIAQAALFERFVRSEGFEPPISAFGGPRVIQLRYERVLTAYFGSSGEMGAAVGMCLNRSSL